MSDLMEAGKYQGEVLDYGWYESDRGEHYPTIIVEFRITGMYGEKGQLEECPRVTRTFRQALTDLTATWIFHNMKALGFMSENIADFDPQSENGANLYGNLFDIRCKHKPGYNGDGISEEWMIESRRRKLDHNDLAPLQAKHSAAIAKVFAKPAFQAGQAEQPAAPNGAAPPRKSKRSKGPSPAEAPSGTRATATDQPATAEDPDVPF
jgi:hypothetical protein